MARRRASGSTFIQRSREASPEFKAQVHDQLGAGKARVKRPFLQLGPREEDWIVREVERRIDRRLADSA